MLMRYILLALLILILSVSTGVCEVFAGGLKRVDGVVVSNEHGNRNGVITIQRGQQTRSLFYDKDAFGIQIGAQVSASYRPQKGDYDGFLVAIQVRGDNAGASSPKGRSPHPAVSGSGIVGTIPSGSIEIEGGCTHYLTPVKKSDDYTKKVVFHWGYPGLDGPKGRCVSNCLPYMHLFGNIVTVQPKSSWLEDMLKNKRIGDSFSEIYQIDSMKIRFDNKITFVCPPKNENTEICEVARFNGVMTVSDGVRKETYQTVGECGL